MLRPTLSKLGNGLLDARWWLEEAPAEGEENKVHEKLTAVVRLLRDRQQGRAEFDRLHARLYGNLRSLGFGVSSHAQTEGIEDDRLTVNLAKSLVGTVVSRLTKNRIKASVVTSGADWELQHRAKLLEQYVEGQFYKTKFRKEAADAFRDACIFGTGAVKLFEQNGELCAQRVPPWLLVVDDGECLTGKPRNLYERRYIDREVVVSAFAEGDEGLTAKIREYKMDSGDDGGPGRDTTADQVLVVEAWHLGPNGKGGRHVICMDNCTLLDEEWNKSRFPFVFVRWSASPVGFFGLGLVSEIIGIQAEVNKLLRQIQHAIHLCAWPRIFLRHGSKINKSQLNNGIGAIIEGNEPPMQISSPVIPPEVYQHLQFLIKTAYEIAGISQMTASGQKPSGVESGVAMMTLQDVQSDRFTEVGRNWEEMHSEAAELFIDLGGDLAKQKKDWVFQSLGDEELLEIAWDEASMEVGQYQLQVMPSSLLPNSVTGRIEVANTLSQMGLLQPLDMFDMINMPDLKAAYKRMMGSRDIVEKTLFRMAAKGEYFSPEPYDDLMYAQKRAQEEYNRGRLRGMPEARLRLFRKYMEQCDLLLNPPPPPDLNAPTPPAPPLSPEGLPPDTGAPALPGEPGELPPEALASPPPPGPDMGAMAPPPA